MIINDNINFETNSVKTQYLGNVLTHEIGHLIGLGHSQLHRSSMFYKLFIGQHTTHEEDKAGVFNLYPSSYEKGVLKGRVMGSTKNIGIFGVHVSAISTNSGKVAASTYSEEDGSFEFKGLNLDDQYYLYLEPAKNIPSLPIHLKSIRTDFCNARASFRGNFFNSCFSSEEGYPVGIKLDSSQTSRDVGDITVSCDLKVSSDYFLKKGGDEIYLDLIENNNVGNAIVGYFSKQEVVKSTENIKNSVDNKSYEDHFRLDISNYNIPSNDYYLEVKIVNQSLYSQIQLFTNVEVPGSENIVVRPGKDSESDLNKDIDGGPTLEYTVRIPLHFGKNSNNNFKLSIAPKRADYSIYPSYGEEDFFPDVANYGDNYDFYFLIVNLVKKEGLTYKSVSMKDYGVLTDNDECPDAPLSYNVVSNIKRDISLSTSSSKKENEDGLPVSCGTIGGGKPPKNPFGSLLVGLVLSVFLLRTSARLKIHS